MLSPEQQYAFSKFKKGENLFITGPGGTGKTKLIHSFYQYAQLESKKKIQICSLTGCSALLLGVHAKTIHSWSGIKIARGTKEQVIDSVLRNKRAVSNWKKTKILVIDEVSMLSQKIFEILDKIGRSVHKNPFTAFGGMQIIFTGDFFQLSPVGNMNEPETEKFCFESPLWPSVFPLQNHIQLKTIFRQNDPQFIQILSEVRYGELSKASEKRLQECVGRDMSDLNAKEIVPTKLFAIRAKSDSVNQLMFSKIEEKEYEFPLIKKNNCTNYIENGDLFIGSLIPSELLVRCFQLTPAEQEYEFNQLSNTIPCSTSLSLKKGALVMCTVNIDMDKGVCNGTCGMVIDILENARGTIPVIKFNNGIVRSFEPYFWQSEDIPTLAVGNIPLILAWAMTIHKSQGVSLEYAQLDLGNTIFADGQTYVGLSRVKTIEGLYLSAFNPLRIRANPLVKEFYKRIPETGLPEAVVDFTPLRINETRAFGNAQSASPCSKIPPPLGGGINVQRCKDFSYSNKPNEAESSSQTKKINMNNKPNEAESSSQTKKINMNPTSVPSQFLTTMKKMDELQEKFCCPITGEVMIDPVIDNEGNSYEKLAIEHWLRRDQTSPITRNRLTLEDLRPNRILKDVIESMSK